MRQLDKVTNNHGLPHLFIPIPVKVKPSRRDRSIALMSTREADEAALVAQFLKIDLDETLAK